MTALAALKTDNSIELDANVVVGGAARITESDIYTFDIELAYLRTAASGALALELKLKSSEGANLNQTLWMTSGAAKGGNNYYVDKQGKKRYLPGFTAANSISMLTNKGKEIGELETEEKVAKLYDYTQQAEVPTKVQMFTDLVGTTVKLGLIKKIEDKNVRNGEGIYVPSGETREVFEIDKVFRASDNMTVAELLAEQTEAVWHDKWIELNRGKVIDRSSKGAQASAAAAPAASSPFGAAPIPAPAAKPAASKLFG